ncbi:MAG: fasciclin domain-containing protein [Flavobacteriales bacterium]
MKKVFYLLGLAFVSLIGLSNAQDNPCGVEGVVVEASNYSFTPANLEIEVGETVVWVNVGGFHDVNGNSSTLGDVWNNPETFALGAVNGNADGVCLGSHTFMVPGTYNYDCSIGSHAANGMVATITVNAPPPSNTVVDIIVNSDDHTLLEAAVIAAGLDGPLSEDGPFTVFAPNDAAVIALTEALEITAEDLLALPNLAEILQYHVVGANAMSGDLSDGQTITTLLGEDVTVTINQNGVMINNAMVTVADVVADNGVVHVIDAVLLPPAPPVTIWDIVEGSEDHTILEQAILAVGLDANLSNADSLTLFAPTDAALNDLMEAFEITAEELLAAEELMDVLLYHVVSGITMSSELFDGQLINSLQGGQIFVNINGTDVILNTYAAVIVPDLQASNGVVHVIDAVLIPEFEIEETVWDLIQESEDHTLLEAAILAAGLDGALSDEEAVYTVFAPVDEAIETLASALSVTLEELLALPNLADILLYHVVGDEYYSDDLEDGQELTALNEGVLNISISDVALVNDAEIIDVDYEAVNGVIHVINSVLLPPTGVMNEGLDKLVVYPNPTGPSGLFIEGSWSSEAVFEIWEASGRKIAELNAVQNPMRIETQGWNSGLYVLRIIDMDRTQERVILVN